MTDTPSIRLDIDGAAAWLTISDPARMNALSAAMWKDLPRLLKQADDDSRIRVVVLRGAGQKAFSAGANIAEFDSQRSGAAASAYDALNEAAFQALARTTKPTVAMIHGFCLGGGLSLALCCDLRLADTCATFAIPAARLGIGYNARWIRPLLAAIGPSESKRLLFTGRRFAAADALAMGLVNELHATETLESAVSEYAQTIAANAPLSIHAAKQAIDELDAQGPGADIGRLDVLVARCMASEDYAEGRLAFAEKRPPVFRGT